MARFSKKNAFTITEMIVVVVILAVLMTLVLKAGKRFKDQADEKRAKSTIEIIVAAIAEYQLHHDRFPLVTIYPKWVPPRVGYTELELSYDILLSLRGNSIIITPTPNPLKDFSCEGLYYFLTRDSDCVSTMKSIPDEYVTNKNEDGVEVVVEVEILDFNGDPKLPQTIIELRRFIDPWGNSYRYSYAYGNSFPVVESAGKDGDFLTVGDNVSSR